MLLFSQWMTTGNIGWEALKDVIEAWTSTKSGKELAVKLDGKKKWFIRLDQMSPKDSTLIGNDPVSTFADVVVKICSSMRAHGCLQRAKQDADKADEAVSMQLILNPWDTSMNPAKEFRVFVPPPAALGNLQPHVKDFKISAISQYRWHHPFSAPFDLTVQEVVECVSEGAQKTLTALVAYIATEMDASMREMVLRYGFSFDVVLKEGKKVELVEINPFGAMSGCGACLFNWVLDGRVLYGLEKAQFAVTLSPGTKQIGLDGLPTILNT